jgi:hypothetical protein
MTKHISSQLSFLKAQHKDNTAEKLTNPTSHPLDGTIADVYDQIQQISIDTRLTLQWIEKTNIEQREIYQSILEVNTFVNQSTQPIFDEDEVAASHDSYLSNSYLFDAFSQKSSQLEQLASTAQEVRQKAEACLMHYFYPDINSSVGEQEL